MGLIDIIREEVEKAKNDGYQFEQEAIEGRVKSYVDLNGLNKANFKDVILSTENSRSAYDSIVGSSVRNGVDHFKDDEMKRIIAERENALIAELKPEETPEQKEIRELREKMTAMENKERMTKLQDELSTAAPEMGLDGVFARKFAGFENPMETMEVFSTYLKEKMSPLMKDQYSQDKPKSGGIEKGLSNMTDAELYKAAANPANKEAILQEIKRRSIPA